MNTRCHWTAIAAVAALAGAFAPSVAAQTADRYPSRPIRILVPFPAGGAADLVARTIGEQVSQRLGQPVVVDNRTGAGGRVATEMLARADPDGYTLLVGTVGGIAISPSLYQKLSYDPARDMAPITMVAEIVNVMVINPSTGVKTVREFVDWAKKRPGETRFGSSGTGQPDHLAGEFFQRLAGIKLTHVAYKGGGPALIDLVAGDLQLAFATYIVASPYLAGGKLRALAVTTPQRQPLLPDLPTVGDTIAGFGLSNWEGIFAPARTSPVTLDRLFTVINEALRNPELKKRQNAAGIEPVGSPSRAAFAEFVKQDTERWAKIVKDANIVVE
jgi:tripartite-type tricarboxylate transporter receptor subunit TctC